MRSTLFNLVFYAFTFGIALALYVASKLSTQARMRRIANFWGRSVRWLVGAILGSRVEVRGLEHVPDRPFLLIGKHQSELDIVMLAVLFPDTSAVAMAELARYPFFGPILKKLDVVSVAVDAGPQGRTEQVVEGAARIFAQGRPLTIYPEGELMKIGARERYRRGAAHIYTRLGPRVVLMANALGVVWPQRRWTKPTGQTGAIEFLPGPAPGLDFERFQAEIERRIEGGSMALVREHAKGPALADAEDRFARGVNNFDEVVPSAVPGSPGHVPAGSGG